MRCAACVPAGLPVWVRGVTPARSFFRCRCMLMPSLGTHGTCMRMEGAARARTCAPGPALSQAHQGRLPGTRLPLTGLDGASAELICHAADADMRAALFGVPAVAVRAAGAAGGGAGTGAGGAQEQAQRWSILKQVGCKAATAPARSGQAQPQARFLLCRGSRARARGRKSLLPRPPPPCSSRCAVAPRPARRRGGSAWTRVRSRTRRRPRRRRRRPCSRRAARWTSCCPARSRVFLTAWRARGSRGRWRSCGWCCSEWSWRRSPASAHACACARMRAHARACVRMRAAAACRYACAATACRMSAGPMIWSPADRNEAAPRTHLPGPPPPPHQALQCGAAHGRALGSHAAAAQGRAAVGAGGDCGLGPNPWVMLRAGGCGCCVRSTACLGPHAIPAVWSRRRPPASVTRLVAPP